MNTPPRFFRYLPRKPSEEDWGAVVLDAGHSIVPPGSDYPLPGHPEDHHFSWEKGRSLTAYTFVYITQGSGVFDSDPSGEIPVKAGSLFILFPHVWHRFRPDPETGWQEYWVECEGEQLEAAVDRIGLIPSHPVLKINHDDALLRCFLNITETIQSEPPSFGPIIAMRTLEIVARIQSLLEIERNDGVTAQEKIVRHAQLHMRQALASSLDFQQLATQLGLSYSAFRRIFKAETGHAPGEYFIEMKINRAKQLLLLDHSVQEVADRLGFDSQGYFSRQFKSRTGKSPTQHRQGLSHIPREPDPSSSV